MLATQLKTGAVYKENNAPWKVLKYEHIKTARGGATVKVRAQNLLTGSVLDKSYNSAAKVEDAYVTRKNTQYLYKEVSFVFMDPDTYEQISVPAKVLAEDGVFLKEGEVYSLMFFENRPVSVDFPNNMLFEVTYTEPGFKGNTVTNAYKEAQLSNGITVKVPSFIKTGDMLRIDTRTRTYVSRE